MAMEGGNKMNLSFAGCGFLGIYHVGVASCIKEHAPHLVSGKISGASAGAIAAVGLVCDSDLELAVEFSMGIVQHIYSSFLGPLLHPDFQPNKYLREGFEKFLPKNAHEMASGRLHVSLTRIYGLKNVIVNQFNTKEELVEALLCSSYIPLFSGLVPPKFQGTRYMDGAFSNNIPVLDEHTITVSPFAGESDICPSDDSPYAQTISLANTSFQLSMNNFQRFNCIVWPPRPEKLSQLCQQGFNDCLKYLRQNTLIRCGRHLSVFTSLHRKSRPLDYDREERKDSKGGKKPSGNPQHKEQKENSQNEAKLVGSSQSRKQTGNSQNEAEREVDEECGDNTDGNSDESISEEQNLECDAQVEVYYYDENDEEEEANIQEIMNCAGCEQHRHVAVFNYLPSYIINGIKASEKCGSFVGRMCNRSRLFRAFAVMLYPYFVPAELIYVLFKRFRKWLPDITSDIQWFIKEFLNIKSEWSEYIKDSGHKYSARYSCQLAIIDVDRPHESAGKSVSAKDEDTDTNDDNSIAALPRGSVSLGFVLDMEEGAKEEDPFENINAMRQNFLEEDDKQQLEVLQLKSSVGEVAIEHVFKDEHGKIHRHLPKVNLMHKTEGEKTESESGEQETENQPKTDERRLSTVKTCTSYDTVDNCFHVATQMESVLSYYYTDVNNPDVVTVAEIYALDDPTGPPAESWVTDLSGAWDHYLATGEHHAQLEGDHYLGEDRHDSLEGSSESLTVADNGLFSQTEEDRMLVLRDEVSNLGQSGKLPRQVHTEMLKDSGTKEMSAILNPSGDTVLEMYSASNLSMQELSVGSGSVFATTQSVTADYESSAVDFHDVDETFVSQ